MAVAMLCAIAAGCGDDGGGTSSPTAPTTITPTGAPVAMLSITPTGAGRAGLTEYRFDGSGSSDPDQDPLPYSWDFGDGARGSGVIATHVYDPPATFADRPDTYNVTLTVSDGTESATQSGQVTVNGNLAYDYQFDGTRTIVVNGATLEGEEILKIDNQAGANFQGTLCISVGGRGWCGEDQIISGVISSNNNFVCPCQVEFTTAQGSSIQRYSFAGTINASGSGNIRLAISFLPSDKLGHSRQLRGSDGIPSLGSGRNKARVINLSVSTGASPRHLSGWRSRAARRDTRTRKIPAAGRAWTPSAAFRDAVRSVMLAPAGAVRRQSLRCWRTSKARWREYLRTWRGQRMGLCHRRELGEPAAVPQPDRPGADTVSVHRLAVVAVISVGNRSGRAPRRGSDQAARGRRLVADRGLVGVDSDRLIIHVNGNARPIIRSRAGTCYAKLDGVEWRPRGR